MSENTNHAPLTDDMIDRWLDVACAATPNDWQRGASPEDGRAYMLETYDKRAAGPVGCVHIDDPERPGESLIVAITGNGPTSEANARHIAYSSPRNVVLVLRELRAARDRIDLLTGQLSEATTTICGLVEGTVRTFRSRAADALADEVDVLVRRKEIDSRSPAADALLSFRDPPSTERSCRLAALEADVAAKQRGYDDLHQMVPGQMDIWTKVDALVKRERALVAGLQDAERRERAALADADELVAIARRHLPPDAAADRACVDRIHGTTVVDGVVRYGAAPAVDLRGLVDALDDAAYEHGEALADTGEKYQAAKVVRREARDALLDRLRALGLAPAPTSEGG